MTQRLQLIIASAVLAAGIIGAGAVIAATDGNEQTATETNTTPENATSDQSNPSEAPGTHSRDGFTAISDDDHIRGPEDASVAVVEFSDFECPYCGQLHPTLKRLIRETNDVQWVYRHFAVHDEAKQTAEAAECVAQIGDNKAFWRFTDTMFENQRKLSREFYLSHADTAGVSRTKLDQCLKSDQHTQAVTADYNEARRLGGRGTPFVVVVTDSGRLIPFSGALPYEQIKEIVTKAKQM